MDTYTTLLLGAFLALCIAGVVVLAVDLDFNHVRRIEAGVARDTGRIRRKILRGWSADRIARRYPGITAEHIARVRRELDRSAAAVEEVRLLEQLWTITGADSEQ